MVQYFHIFHQQASTDGFFIQGLGLPPPNLKKSGEVFLLLAPHQFQGDETALHQVEFDQMQIIFIMQEAILALSLARVRCQVKFECLLWRFLVSKHSEHVLYTLHYSTTSDESHLDCCPD